MGLFLTAFCEQEQAQDLVEYTLLVALIALAFVAVMTEPALGINGIWQQASPILSNANNVVAAH
jgi:Flp pilus assembly pilin Flp